MAFNAPTTYNATPNVPYGNVGTTLSTATDRVANLDINDYSRNMFGTAFSELTAAQREDVAASMRSDQRAATGGSVPADSEAATATRLANRAMRASDREAVRDRDDYAMATYGCSFAALTPAQMEDVSNYMRDDEKRTYGTVIAGGEAAMAKRQADIAFSQSTPAMAAGTTYPAAGTAYDTARTVGTATDFMTAAPATAVPTPASMATTTTPGYTAPASTYTPTDYTRPL